MSEALTPEEGVIPVEVFDIDSLANYASSMHRGFAAMSKSLDRSFSDSPAYPFMSQGLAIGIKNGEQTAEFYDQVVQAFRTGDQISIVRNSIDVKQEPRYMVDVVGRTPSTAKSTHFPRTLGQAQLEHFLDGFFPLGIINQQGSLMGSFRTNPQRRSQITGLNRGQEVQLKPPVPGRSAQPTAK
jgi:hypothetical protein